MSAVLEGIAGVLGPILGECGRRGLPCLSVDPREQWCDACDRSAAVAAAVTVYITERLESDEVRGAALADWERASHDERWTARAGYDAALAAVTEALRGAS